MRFPCTGVILAGGENKRFNGKNKAFLTLNGRRIMDRLYGVFRELFEEIIIVTNNPEKYLEWDALIVADVFPIRASLTGLHAGLFYASNQFAFFSACDTPFLRKELVECVLQHINPKFHAIIPSSPGGLEPLCAAYARDGLPAMQRHLENRDFKIQRLFSKNRMKLIPETELRKADPELISFFNVNSPQDLENARNMQI